VADLGNCRTERHGIGDNPRMKLGSLASARPNYYDRNPITIAGANSQNITGNTVTTLTMYTVPASKKSIISLMSTEFYATAALTGAGAYVAGYWQVTIASTAATSNIMYARFAKTAIGDEQFHPFSPSFCLNAGDILKFVASGVAAITGGNINILGSFGGTEFDA